MEAGNLIVISSRTLAIAYLTTYGCWWAYFFYFLYISEYDNNSAGATASVAVGSLTAVITLAYILEFSVAAIRSKENKRFFCLAVLILLLPWAGILLAEWLRGR